MIGVKVSDYPEHRFRPGGSSSGVARHGVRMVQKLDRSLTGAENWTCLDSWIVSPAMGGPSRQTTESLPAGR